MNLKEYLDSGIIEDYCLGVLNPIEMRAVARNAQRYQEIKDTIDLSEEVLKRYTENLDVDNIMGKKNEEILSKLLKKMKNI
jgi:anti-sigma-K factor RskA